MKTVLFFLLLSFNPIQLFPQKSPGKALRFDGVYFTKPQRSSSSDVWSVRCLRFYHDKTVILTSIIYPDQGFDMSRFDKQFNKKQLPPETARGKYILRNDSLLFSTESYFKATSGTRTISNTYRALTLSPDSLKLERQNDYSETEIRSFYFRAFLKTKPE